MSSFSALAIHFATISSALKIHSIPQRSKASLFSGKISQLVGGEHWKNPHGQPQEHLS